MVAAEDLALLNDPSKASEEFGLVRSTKLDPLLPWEGCVASLEIVLASKDSPLRVTTRELKRRDFLGKMAVGDIMFNA
jgi:hypothetical protein